MSERIMPFGKHKGEKLDDIPAGYWIWFLEQDWSHKWPEIERYALNNETAILQEVEEGD